MSCLMSIEQILSQCVKKIFQIQPMSYSITCKDKRFAQLCFQEIWYTFSGLNIQLQQSWNDNPACKKILQGCKTWLVIMTHKSYFSVNQNVQTCGLVVKASCSISGKMVLIPTGCWNSAAHRPFLRSTEPNSGPRWGSFNPHPQTASEIWKWSHWA